MGTYAWGGSSLVSIFLYITFANEIQTCKNKNHSVHLKLFAK